MNSNESRNIVIAFILSIAVLVSWNYFFPNQVSTNFVSKEIQSSQFVSNTQSWQTGARKEKYPTLSRHDQSIRIKIDTPKIQGTVRTVGCRFDDITLKDYTLDPKCTGNYVRLLGSEPNLYYSEFGWLSADKSLVLPDAETPWHIRGHRVLSFNQPIIMQWDNGQGLTFVRRLSVDDQYMFTITDTVHNTRQSKVALAAYGLIARNLPDKLGNFFILHEGPIGYLDKKLIELKYSDFEKTKYHHHNAVGGWLGITDKYWLTALVPDQKSAININYRETLYDNVKRYQTDYATSYLTLNPGQNLIYTHRLYAGAKKLEILDNYETKFSIPHFDLAVDFGWFYFLTKPTFYFLTALGAHVKNFGIAILMFTLLLKLIMFPLANKSYRSMARMRELQPKIEQLKARCGG